MVQILSQRGLGEIIGEGLGTGLSSGVQSLAKSRIEKMQKRDEAMRNAMGLTGSGRSPEEALKLSLLSPDIRKEVIKQQALAPQRNASANASQAISNIERGFGGQNIPSQPMAEQVMGQDLPEANQQQQGTQKQPLTAESINKKKVELDNVISQAEKEGVPLEQLKYYRSQANNYTDTLWKELESQQKDERFKENLSIQREKTAAPYLKDLREKIAPAHDIVRVTDEILDSIEDPNLQLGSIKSFISSRFQNDATQKFVAKINELVSLKLQMGKGLPTKLRIALEQAAKPQQYQSKQTIGELTTSIKDGIRELTYEEDIKDQIIAESGDMFPNSLEQKIKRRYKLTKDLPDPTGYAESSIIEDDETGKKFARAGSTWLPL